MTGTPQVIELLEAMLELRKSPEEVCRDCPELLTEVQGRWQQFCLIDSQIRDLFPDVGTIASVNADAVPPPTRLPQIPDYEVEAVLGHGGMGIVFKARHLRLNRLVAVKMALVGAFAESQERQRFQREAEAVAALHHPNIVQIYDVGDSDGQPFFTMEYVEGGTLAEQLTGAPQSARHSATLVAVLAGAVQAAHAGGIIHRDLKPANVLITSDGIPKISDFGLARRMESGSELTSTGAAVGTPRYMAPEQIRNHADKVGASVDIYALGVILYEMLTAQPPFQGATAAATVLQVLSTEPTPPSRLNCKIPRDLETICLKCLQKSAQLRYPTAAALREDLERFLRNEAIEARPIGRCERLFRWITQNPLATALICTALTLVGVAFGAGMREWAVSAERHAEMQSASSRLDHLIRLQQEGRFPEARELSGRIPDLPALRNRIERARMDLDLAERLDRIRLGRASRLGERLAFQRSADDYAVAFHEAGLATPDDPPEAAAARVQSSNIQIALVAALDDWAACASDATRQQWLLDVVHRADHDPTGWRQIARDPMTWKNSDSLMKVVADAPVVSQSVPLLLALADHFKSSGGDPIPFLTRVQQAHPSDFWINLRLGEALMEANDVQDAIRFYQAAIALRPQASIVYDHLGLALAMLGRMREADEQFRLALQINPTAASVHDHLGIAVSNLGRRDELIDDSNLPRQFGQQVAALHVTLGDSLRDQGKSAEAVERYLRAIAINPRLTLAYFSIRSILTRQGRLEEVKAIWDRAVAANPPDFDAWDGYAELCLYFGNEAEYRRTRKVLLGRFASQSNPRYAERTGRACLLLPGSEDEVEAAAELVDRALMSDPTEPYFHFAKGILDYRRDRHETAIHEMTGPARTVLGPAPRLITAMSQFRLKRSKEASQTLAEAIRSFDWKVAALTRDLWIYHILRREAEALILPNLQGFLSGNYRPTDNTERLMLLDGCGSQNCTAAAAQLYLDVFAADSTLQKDLNANLLYDAGRMAALAGCGMGSDAKKLSANEYARWRAQALQWLHASLTVWESALDRQEATRERVLQSLSKWRNERDLKGLYESAALQSLPPEERSQCEALWRRLSGVLNRAEKAN